MYKSLVCTFHELYLWLIMHVEDNTSLAKVFCLPSQLMLFLCSDLQWSTYLNINCRNQFARSGLHVTLIFNGKPTFTTQNTMVISVGSVYKRFNDKVL